MGASSEKPAKRRVRPLLLILLLVWAVLVFMVIDLFLNVGEFDGVRPRARLYRGMRKAAHEMVGEPHAEDISEPFAHRGTTRREGFTAGRVGPKRAPIGRRVHRHLPRGTSEAQLKHGMYTQWNDPGHKRAKGEYLEGMRHGTWVWLWPDGSKREERNYRHSILHGKVVAWYANGQKGVEEEWFEGRPNGTWRSWHPNGRKAAEELYETGRIEGAVVHWHEDGQTAAEAVYKAGKPQGVMNFWHPNGVKAEQCEFVDGKRHGRWTKWDEAGYVTRDEVWERGRKVK